MIITMITEDNSITIDGDQLTVPVAADLGEWAVQFDGESAEIEYTDKRPNEIIDAAIFYARYQTDIDAHAAERLALDDAAALASIPHHGETPEPAISRPQGTRTARRHPERHSLRRRPQQPPGSARSNLVHGRCRLNTIHELQRFRQWFPR